MPDYHTLDVWKLAHETALTVYQLTKPFPSSERYGLTAQMRRSAVSIAANVADGAGRGSDPDFARFLALARGSANETEYHALLARDLGYLDAAAWARLTALIGQTRSKISRLRTTLTAQGS